METVNIRLKHVQMAVMTQSVLLARLLLKHESGRSVMDEEAMNYVTALSRVVAARLKV